MKKELFNTITNEVYGTVLYTGSKTIEELADVLDLHIMQTEDDYAMQNGVDVEELGVRDAQ